MKKKTQSYLIIGLVIVGIISFLFLNGVIKLPTSIIGNPIGQCFKTITTNADTFVCNYSSCIVSGSINPNGVGTTSYGCDLSTCTPIKFDSMSQCQSTYTKCSNGVACSSQHCNVITVQKYQAYFNFKPSNNPGFSGITQSINSANSGPFYTTDSQVITYGQYVTFKPSYDSNGNIPVTNKTITAQLCDNTCSDKVKLYDTTACDPNEGYVLCRPTTTSGTQCPNGYQRPAYLTGIYCNSGVFNKNTHYEATEGPFCYSGTQYNADCEKTLNVQVLTTYSTCTASKSLPPNGITCGAYSSAVLNDTTGKKCYTKDSNFTQLATTTSVGAMQCDNNICIGGKNSRTGIDGASSFQETTCNTCTSFINTKNCLTGTFYVATGLFKQTCQLPQSNVCTNPGTICNPSNSKQIRTCSQVPATGIDGEDVSGLQWSNYTNCDGEKSCSNNICTCVNQCDPTKDVQCSGSNYFPCSQTSDNNSCYQIRTSNPLPVPTGYSCVNSKLVPKTTCSYNPLVCDSSKGQFCDNSTNLDGICSCKCSSLKDSRSINLESCDSNNYCVQPTDSYSATVGQTKCFGNTIYSAKSYVDNNVGRTFYRYEIKNDASNSNNGVCSSDFSCNNGQCISNNLFIGINSLNFYAVGSPFTNLTLTVSDKVPSKAQAKVTAQIFSPSGLEPISDNNYLPISNQGVSGDGTLNLNFGTYSPSVTGNYKLQVTVTDVNGLTYQYSKTLVVAKTLKLNLGCPFNAVINRDIVCTLDIEDASCLLGSTCPVATNPIISINQGSNQITNYQLGQGSTGATTITFQSGTLGIVDVSVSASATDYISASAIGHVTIGSPVIGSTVLINNKDYTLAQTSSLAVGSQDITITPLISGQPLDTSAIKVEVTNPSAGVDVYTLSNSPQSPGIWTGKIKLEQAGQTYSIKVTIIPTDASKRSDPNNFLVFSITTLKTNTSDWWSNYAIIIVAIVGIIIVFFIIIIVVIKSRKPSIQTLPIG